MPFVMFQQISQNTLQGDLNEFSINIPNSSIFQDLEIISIIRYPDVGRESLSITHQITGMVVGYPFG
jgi:hypothetical protein